jgi:hypothetical protein
MSFNESVSFSSQSAEISIRTTYKILYDNVTLWTVIKKQFIKIDIRKQREQKNGI